MANSAHLDLALIPLLLLWAAVVTALAPKILATNRLFASRPRLGLLAWFTALLCVLVAAVSATELAVVYVVDAWLRLSITSVGIQNLVIVVVQSLGPWVMIAAFSGFLALANSRIEPMRENAQLVKQAMGDGLAKDFEFEGVWVSWLAVEIPIAFVARVGKRNRIVVSKAARQLLTQEQLTALLWHEVGHIWGMHNALKRVAYLFQAIFPRLLASKALVFNVERLCELEADKFAATKVPPELLTQTRSVFSF